MQTIDYLGVRLGWKRSADLTLTHRLKKARYAMASLRAWWKRSALHLESQVHLYVSTVLPVLTYGLAGLGLTAKGRHTLETEVFRHIRRLVRMPAHLTQVSNADLLKKFDVIHPVLRVQLSCCRLWRQMISTLDVSVCEAGLLDSNIQCHCDTQTPWWQMTLGGLKHVSHDPSLSDTTQSICTLRCRLSALDAQLLREVHHRGVLPADRDSPYRSSMHRSDPTCITKYVCPDCGRGFPTYNQLRSHQYSSECPWEKLEATFVPEHDCGQALPICRWCQRSFNWWGALESHISKGQCEALHLRPPAPAESERRDPPYHLHLDLSRFCVICARWFPLTRSLTKHLKSAHPLQFASGKSAYELADFRGMKFKTCCPYCNTGHSTNNLLPHIKHHCTVLLQRFIAQCPEPLRGVSVSCEHASLDAHGKGLGSSASNTLLSTGKRAECSLGRPSRTQIEASTLGGEWREHGCQSASRVLREGEGEGEGARERKSPGDTKDTKAKQRRRSWPPRRPHHGDSGHASFSVGQVGAFTSRTTSESRTRDQCGIAPWKVPCQERGASAVGLFAGMEIAVHDRFHEDKRTTSHSLAQVHSRIAVPQVHPDDQLGRDLSRELPHQQPLLRDAVGREGGKVGSTAFGPHSQSGAVAEVARRTQLSLPRRLTRKTKDPAASREDLPGGSSPCTHHTQLAHSQWHAVIRDLASSYGALGLAPDRRLTSRRSRASTSTCRISSEDGAAVTELNLTPLADTELNITTSAVTELNSTPLADTELNITPLALPRLINNGTLCYINSVAFMIAWASAVCRPLRHEMPNDWREAIAALGMLSPSTRSSSNISDVEILVPSLPAWGPLLEGWRLGAQEDVSEFLQHILQRAPIPSVSGTMVLLNPSAVQPEIQHFVLLNVPVPVPSEDVALDRPCCINSVLDAWSRDGRRSGDRTCLLQIAPRLLLVQLMRYCFRGRVVKTHTPIAIPDVVRVPCLLLGEISTVSYKHIASILHHGDDPTHGHYTTLAIDSLAGTWHLDDANRPRELSRSDVTAIASQDMYIICLERV